ncbi:MAG: DUF4157 domain-containing protein, partial [Bacteroidota bacterium]
MHLSHQQVQDTSSKEEHQEQDQEQSHLESPAFGLNVESTLQGEEEPPDEENIAQPFLQVDFLTHPILSNSKYESGNASPESPISTIYEHEADKVSQLLTPIEELDQFEQDAPVSLPLISRIPRSYFSALSAEKKVDNEILSLIQHAQKGSWQRLPTEFLTEMKQYFAFDFGAVQIYTGLEADSLNQQIGSRAFTFENHIFFGHSQYDPFSEEGRELLIHELTHVVQQSRLPEGVIQQKPGNSSTTRSPAKDSPTSPEILDSYPELTNKGLESNPTPAVPYSSVPNLESVDVDGLARQSIEEAKKNLEEKQKREEQENQEKDTDTEKAASLLGGMDNDTLGLIDEELAEHQRWGAAAKEVGAAGSSDRAEFIAQKVDEGIVGEGLKGLGMGLGMGIGTKLLEVGAVKITMLKSATNLGFKAASKATPLPAIGAVIGGAMSVYSLYQKDWTKSGETIGKFGKGNTDYEKLANSIDAISEIIDIASNVLNVIAGIIGAISIASWAIAIATVGAASPLAATLSAISVAIGLATLALDAINAIVLKPLATTFRALHTFTSEADPRDIVAQGEAIKQTAGAAGGFVGGMAGGLSADAAGNKAVAKYVDTPPKDIPDHPTPPPAKGDGPTIKAEPPEKPVSDPSSEPEQLPLFPDEAPTPKPADGPEQLPLFPDEAPLAKPDDGPEVPIPKQEDNPNQLSLFPDEGKVPSDPEQLNLPFGEEGRPKMADQDAPPAKVSEGSEPTVKDSVGTSDKGDGGEGGPPSDKDPQKSAKTKEDAEANLEKAIEEVFYQEMQGRLMADSRRRELAKREAKKGLKSFKDTFKKENGREPEAGDFDNMTEFIGENQAKKAAQDTDPSEVAAQDIEEKRIVAAKGEVEGARVDPDFQNIPEAAPTPYMKRGEKRPGTLQIDPEGTPPQHKRQNAVKSSLRAQARKAAIQELHDALTGKIEHNARTQKTLEDMSADQIVAFVENKDDFPKGFDFDHYMTVADFPEWAHLPESGVLRPHKEHMVQGHGLDPTRPKETASDVNPNEKDLGFHIAPDVRNEAGFSPKLGKDEIAAGSSRSSGKGIDAEIKTQFDVANEAPGAASRRKAARKVRRGDTGIPNYQRELQKAQQDLRQHEQKIRSAQRRIGELEKKIAEKPTEPRQEKLLEERGKLTDLQKETSFFSSRISQIERLIEAQTTFDPTNPSPTNTPASTPPNPKGNSAESMATADSDPLAKNS